MNPIDENTIKECNNCASKGLKYSQKDGRPQIMISEDYMRDARDGMDYMQQAAVLAGMMSISEFENGTRRRHPLRSASRGNRTMKLLEVESPVSGVLNGGRKKNVTLAQTDAADVLPFLQEEDKPLEMPPKKEEPKTQDGSDKAEEEGPPKPEWGSPDKGNDYPSEADDEEEHIEIKKRPKKGDGPTIVYPDEDKVKDFNDEWDKSDAWLPDGPIVLSCPYEVEHKVQLFWVNEESVGIAQTRADAEKLAAGALETHDPQEIAEKNIKDGLLETQVNRLLDDRGWTCVPKCERAIEFSGYLYDVHVMTKIEAALQREDDGSTKDVFSVKLFEVHRLYAWVRIKCKK